MTPMKETVGVKPAILQIKKQMLSQPIWGDRLGWLGHCTGAKRRAFVTSSMRNTYQCFPVGVARTCVMSSMCNTDPCFSVAVCS